MRALGLCAFGPIAFGAVLLAQEPAAVSPGSVFVPGSVTVDGVTLPYQLLRPKVLATTICANDRRGILPLVVFLHGAGERGSDNQKQLTWLVNDLAKPEMAKRYRCFVLAVQCPEDRMWVDVPWAETHSRALADKPSLPLRAVQQAMADVEKSLPVDRDRVYLTGLSMGGYGCWDLAMRDPFHFAAVVPVCGGGDEKQCLRLFGLPIWVWHGADDRAVPVERSRSMVEALRAIGQPVEYTELPGVGHDSWKQAYGEHGALDWLFEQDRIAQGRHDERYGLDGFAPALQFAVVPHNLGGPNEDGEFAATKTMRVVASPELNAIGEVLAGELGRALGVAVPVVSGDARPGDVQLQLTAGHDGDPEPDASIEFAAVATIEGRTRGHLAAAAGAFVQALGSLPGLRAPFGWVWYHQDTGAALAVDDPKGTLPAAALAEALRRCWLFGIGNLFVPGEPARDLVARGRVLGVVVAGLSALPAAHVRVLRIEASTRDELVAAFRVALPQHREQPDRDEALANFRGRLARIVRATGW
jgi:dienelactone hydrolase